MQGTAKISTILTAGWITTKFCTQLLVNIPKPQDPHFRKYQEYWWKKGTIKEGDREKVGLGPKGGSICEFILFID